MDKNDIKGNKMKKMIIFSKNVLTNNKGLDIIRT